MDTTRKTNEQFLEELKRVHNDKIILLEKYINIDTKITFKCAIDGYEWKTTPYILLKGSGCPCCSGSVCVEEINSVYKLRQDLIEYFVNINDAKSKTVKSGAYAECRCPNCGYIKNIKICNLSNCGFRCNVCNDKISIPNKFVHALLKSLKIEHNLEQRFEWSQNKIYDVYISDYNNKRIIIENQGIQHKDGTFKNMGGRGLNDEILNDSLKKELALKNGIDIYIEVYFYNKYNTLHNCKKSVLTSQLNAIFNLTNVNWSELWEGCQRSLVVEIWEEWNNTNKNKRSTIELGKIYGLDRKTVSNYLKLGASINKVNYNPSEERKAFKDKCGNKHPSSKKVICLNTKEIFESINLAKKKYKGNISDCCSGKIEYANKLNNGEKLVWKYYVDYINMSTEEISDCIKIANTKQLAVNKSYKKIVCLNTGELFNNYIEASKKYKVNYKYIKKCCENKYSNCQSCGVSKDGVKLIWRYYDEYINMTQKDIEEVVKRVNNLKKGKNHYKTKKIICLNTNKIFNSQKDAGEY